MDSLLSPPTGTEPFSDMTPEPSSMMTPLTTIDEDEIFSDSEKKPTKKRKSWGQVLPEPKTNLPPRKRAKTDDEKEQRRVERVLRNRRAAQSSRERKRLEVEALEQRNKELEDLLRQTQEANRLLVERLDQYRGSGSPSPLRSDNTLSAELFGSQMMNTTVNPASLSPELTPVTDAPRAPEPSEPLVIKAGKALSTSDLTQRPAEMLCDLQCQSEEMPKSFLASRTSTPTWALATQMFLLSVSATLLAAFQRPLMQIAISSKAGFSLRPSPQILATIIWLVTIPPATPSPTSTSTPSSTMTLWQRAMAPLRTSSATSASRSPTLRIRSLRKILSSSPNLARPLLDATMEALRLASEKRCLDSQVEISKSENADAPRGGNEQLRQCLRDVTLPSQEVLITLMWALKLELVRQDKRRLETGKASSFHYQPTALRTKMGTRRRGLARPARLR